jgi:nicotinate-nucleotide pyrophosphorylase (carboxylating)
VTLNATVAGRLLAVGLDPDDTERAVRGALEEDLRYGPDLTSAATTAPGARAAAGVVAREPGVLAGIPVVLAVLDLAGIAPGAAEPLRADGDRIDGGAEVIRIRAPQRELLGAERTLLNFLLTCRASPPRRGRGRTPCPARAAPCVIPGRPLRGCVSSRSMPCGAAAA